MAKRQNNKTLDWDYCECGCKGHSVSIGSLHYWIGHDLTASKKGFCLVEGHGYILGKVLGDYDSFKEADGAAQRHARPRVRKVLAELKRAAKALQL